MQSRRIIKQVSRTIVVTRLSTFGARVPSKPYIHQLFCCRCVCKLSFVRNICEAFEFSAVKQISDICASDLRMQPGAVCDLTCTLSSHGAGLQGHSISQQRRRWPSARQSPSCPCCRCETLNRRRSLWSTPGTAHPSSHRRMQD